ncbi:MAG: TonB family protein [Opitutales bacterium]
MAEFDGQTQLGPDDPGPDSVPVGAVLGQYRVDRLLGRGGMGTAYAATHTVLNQTFALKVIHPEVLAQATGLDRFKREAQVMAGLKHPAILPVDDFGETEGRVWLRMPLVEGVPDGSGGCWITLADQMAAGPVDPETTRTYLGRILEGLAFAHQQGVVHRDLKPENILLIETGPLIADFGLVKLADADWLKSQVELSVVRSQNLDAMQTQVEGGTAPGSSTRALMGTFAFMSPEQKRGVDVDARSDLYTLGQIAYLMLTGAQSLGMRRPSERIEELDTAWDVWILRLLEESPDDRFASASEALAALPGSADESTGAQPGPQRAPSEAEPRRLPWLPIGLVLLVLALGVGGFFWFEAQQEAAAAEAEQTRLLAEERQADETLAHAKRLLEQEAYDSAEALLEGLVDHATLGPEAQALLGSLIRERQVAVQKDGLIRYIRQALAQGQLEEAKSAASELQPGDPRAGETEAVLKAVRDQVAERDEVVAVSELDRTPRMLRRGTLTYPFEMKRERIEGLVRLKVTIEKDGSVGSVNVMSSSHRAFIQPAIDAAAATLFSPPTKDGQPVRTAMLLPFSFKIKADTDL